MYFMIRSRLTNSCLSNDPGKAQEEHHTPDIEQTSHLSLMRDFINELESGCIIAELTNTPSSQPNLITLPFFCTSATASLFFCETIREEKSG